MKAKFPFKTLFLLLIFFSFFNCSKEEIIPTDVETNNFVWLGMNAYYKYQGEIEDLADNRFSTRSQLNDFLSEFITPEELFNHLLLNDLNVGVDDCSFIINDFNIIEEAIENRRFTTGMKVYGVEAEDSGDFYLYVYDVVENSNAARQGVVRGMIITEINGASLTLASAESFLNTNSFSISIADYNDGNPEIPFDDPLITTDDPVVIALTKESIQENPIKIATSFNVGGQNIGYLMYNGFIPDFDDELNSVFGAFKGASLDNLIVDLRYNGGGSVETATYLASMITGQFNNDVFSRQVWNDKVMTNVINQNLTNFFTDEIDNGIVKQRINSLGLSTVYFIVSDATANASEVLINGLEAHIPNGVKLIGTQTLGLAEASLTVYDSADYTKNGENFNGNHNYVLQPIVLEVQNAINTNKAGVGHEVGVEIGEDPGNLGVLGTASDPVLFNTIEYITNGTMPTIGSVTPIENLLNSNALFLGFNKMYVTLRN